MTRSPFHRSVGTSSKLVGSLVALVLWLGVGALVAGSTAGAAELPVGLGTADSFAVLGAAGVTNTGPSVVNGDLGSCPTPAVIGLPPLVVNGAVHQADAEACGAQADVQIAYDDAAGRAPTTTYPGPTDLGGSTLTPGVYMSPTSFAITGTLTLDAQGDPDAVFVFQAGSTVVTATGSSVSLVNAQACNVYWQVGSSATLGAGSTFVGTVLALAAITADTGALVEGRLLARVESVTLDTNVITTPACAPPATTSTSTVASSTSTTSAGSGSTTSTSTGASTSTTSGTGGATTTSTAGPTTTIGGNIVAQVTSTTARATPSTTGTSTTATTRPSGTVTPSATTTTTPRLTGLPRTGTPAWWKVGTALLAVLVGSLMVRFAAQAPLSDPRRDWTA
jgi:hypothetical protein